MDTISKVYAHAKNLYVRAIFPHSGVFCAIDLQYKCNTKKE